MLIETIKKLNTINRKFYKHVGDYFDSSRNYFWEGWTRLIPLLKELETKGDGAKVVDVGCGNARFLEFLCGEFDFSRLEYVGVDSSLKLIKRAEKRILLLKEKYGNKINSKLIKQDIILEKLDWL